MKSLLGLGLLGAGVGAAMIMGNRYMSHNAKFNDEIANLQQQSRSIPQTSDGESVAGAIAQQAQQLNDWKAKNIIARIIVAPPVEVETPEEVTKSSTMKPTETTKTTTDEENDDSDSTF